MGVIVTAVFGLVIWIVLWAMRVSGFDAILIGVSLAVIAAAVHNVLPNLARRRNR